jgi:hypothetical protein
MTSIDLENELAEILLEEIQKEIAANGSFTWVDICEKEKLSQ